MKIIRCDYSEDDRYENTQLGDSDIKEFKKVGADVAAYWYQYGYYKGRGNVIFHCHDGGGTQTWATALALARPKISPLA